MAQTSLKSIMEKPLEEERAQEVCCASLLPLFPFLSVTFVQTLVLDLTGTICNSSLVAPYDSFEGCSLSESNDLWALLVPLTFESMHASAPGWGKSMGWLVKGGSTYLLVSSFICFISISSSFAEFELLFDSSSSWSDSVGWGFVGTFYLLFLDLFPFFFISVDHDWGHVSCRWPVCW